MASLSLPLISCRKQAEHADVLVLGAGLAGLYAAMLLEEQGFKPLVLEARDRVGGRMMTLDHLPGHPEAGGQTIGGMYARVFTLAEQLGLKLYNRNMGGGLTIAHNGELLSAEDWGTSPENPVTGALRLVRPDRLYGRAVDAINPLSDVAAWLDPASAAYDKQSISAALLAADVKPSAIDLMDIAFDGQAAGEMSALFAYRKELVSAFNRESAWRIENGSQRLPEAMAAQLSEEVRLGKVVQQIDNAGRDIEVTCSDGSQYTAGAMLCSIPFPALSNVEFSVPPTTGLSQAIASLPYTPITHVHLAFDRPFWEDDGLPLQMWSNHPLLERVFASNDASGAPVGLVCWFNGAGANRVDRLSEEELSAQTPQLLGELRPAAKGNLRTVAVKSWANDPFAGGAYHFFAPGQITAFRSDMREPFGRIRFIGEHMADLQQGMEGALESAEREALALMQEI